MPSVEMLVRIKELEAENEQLKKEVADYHQLQWQHDALIDENEKLKAEREEANSWDDSWKMAEQITQLEKCLVNARKENAKLKCLALHAMSELFYYKREYLEALPVSIDHAIEKYFDLWAKFSKAYHKTKKELMEGK